MNYRHQHLLLIILILISVFSTKKSLPIPHQGLVYIRKEGYCHKLCGFGTQDLEADGYQSLVKHYHRTKALGELDKGPYSYNETDMTDYSTTFNVSFDEQNEFFSAMNRLSKGNKCIQYCLEELFENEDYEDFIPSFADISSERQDFESCLKDFNGLEADAFDFQNSTALDFDTMLHYFRKTGLISFKNFFPLEFMTEIHDILTTWEDIGNWNNLTFTDFFSAYKDQLVEYENRLEIALPYTEPFESLLNNLHSSVVMELMREYAKINGPKRENWRQINMEFPSSIMSRPGARAQGIHSDHGYDRGMIKVNIAIHDIPEISGPTHFCPCTHKYGMNHIIFNKDCVIRYSPKLVKASTLTMYDQALQHQGSANTGTNRRYILDISYNIDEISSTYVDNYPDLAQDHVRRFREDLRDL